MGEKIQGKRKYSDDDGHLRLADGEYGYSENHKRWEARPPGQHVSSIEKHDVMVHEDNSITVSPSILISDGSGELWHGFLRRGVWEEC